MADLPPCCTPPRRMLPLSPDYFERVGYAGYNAGGDAETAGLNYQGKPCPNFEDLPENIRAKWASGRADMARAFLFELQLSLDYELAPAAGNDKAHILATMARLMGVDPPLPRRQPED